jgi:predicted ATPase with chaperone activity
MIHSVAGILAGGALTDRRPFRSPHHSASMPALVGGGAHARPGEISLAHNGVLFLDELPEFQPQVLDSLRQPIETGEVSRRHFFVLLLQRLVFVFVTAFVTPAFAVSSRILASPLSASRLRSAAAV